MSRKANNAVMESFYHTLNRELVQDANYDNPEQARMEFSNILNFTTILREFILHWLA
jgi:hypothetical protein